MSIQLMSRSPADCRVELPYPCAFVMAIAGAVLSVFVAVGSAHAQEVLQPGEGYVTRFSGTTVQDGRTVIDTGGTVASVIDLRTPGQAPEGRHWQNEPQRLPVTAAQVGQVFGVAFDDATPPNIYVTATAAFGLHRTADNTDWMEGQWGPDAGPGTVWKLSATNNYSPEVFARITLDGRANTGAALGNIAFDRWTQQLYVSDLETGMIHRLRISDGADLGHYDHGVTGRATFQDVANQQFATLAGVPFDPTGSARTDDCPSGDFARDPSCWSFADFRRRVWGLGVRRDLRSEEVRLYYAVWSSQGFGHADFAGAAADEKRNSLWSVGINADGTFNAGSVRREFFLPDFFRSPEAIARAGRSHPVSDIAFPAFGDQTVMLLAERGGVRNRGLTAENAFTHPNEARVLRYEMTDLGAWRGAGRYDVGYYDRREAGPPYIRAGAAGGVSFGTGYGETNEIDPAAADVFVWITGDGLCSPAGPCLQSATNERNDDSEVHGLQGRAVRTFEAFEPMNAFEPYPEPGPVMPPTGPDQSYMIDIDVGVDDAGAPIEAEHARNDAGRIGDVEVYQQEPPEGLSPVADFVPPGTVPGFPEGLPPEGWVPAPLPPDGWHPPPPFPLDTDLAIAKAGPAQCQEGVNCAYTITITNVGSSTYIGPLAISDTMPPGATLDEATSGWDCVTAGANVSCVTHSAALLNPGESAAITLTMLLPAGIPAGTVRNCVVINWGEMGTDDGPGDGNDEACIDTPVIDGFDMGLTKIGPVNCVENADCSFGVLVGNFGPGEFNGVVAIRDTLPAGTTLVLASGLGGPGSFSCTPIGGDDVRCVSPSIVVPAGAFAAIVVRVRLPAGNVGGTYQNCARIDWDTMGANDGATDVQPDEDCHTVNVLAGAAFHDLTISKRGPAHCNPGATCNFQLTVTNNGPGVYNGEIRVRDSAVPVGSGFIGPIPGWACVHAPPDLTCTLPGGPHTLNPGDTRTYTVTLAIPNPAPGNPLINCARLTFGDGFMPLDDNPPPGADEGSDGACMLVNLNAGFDFEIAKSASAPECYEGGICDFEVNITNNGPANFSGYLPIIDRMPVDAALQSVSGLNLDCPLVAGREVTCTLLALPLFPVGHTHTTTVSTRLPDPVAGDTAENCVRIDWSAPPPAGYSGLISYTNDDDGSNNGPVCAAVDVLAADLRPFGGTVCKLGSSCTLDVKVENSGGKLFKGAAGLKGSLDPAVKISSIKSLTTGFTCKATGNGTYECDSDELALKPGSAAKLKLVVEIPADFPHRRIIHRKEMLWPDPKVKDKKPENDRHTSTIMIHQPEEEREVVPTPTPEPDFDLVVKKTGPASCTPGGLCEYTISVVNAGPGTYRGNVYLFDTYPGYMESSFVTSSAGWDCFDSRGTVECRHDVVELGPRESVSLRITILLAGNIADDTETRAEGGARNCARIDWPGKHMTDERHRNFWIERILVQEGLLDKNQLNGVLGAADRDAIRRYQSAHGLKPTGAVDAALWNRMFPHSGRLEGDRSAGNDNRCIVTPLTPEIPPATLPPRLAAAPDIAISKLALQPGCSAGQTCGFAVVTVNSGQGTFFGPLQITDILTPAGARLAQSGPAPWACRSLRGRVRCNHPATQLAPGESNTLSLAFTTSRNAKGTLRNCATIDWSQTARVRAAQRALSQSGFPAGTPDGKAGARTRKAVRDYQKRVGLPVTGRIDNALMRRLFGEWANGDARADNDRACMDVEIEAPELPPVVAPPPRCEAGWTEMSQERAKILSRRGWQVKRVARSGRTIWCAQRRTAPPVTPTCTGGRTRNDQGQCVCPSSRPNWTGQRCIACTGGTRWNAQKRACIKPTPTCSGGRIWSPRKNTCVCPSNKPHWTGQSCIACTGGTRWNAQKRACIKPTPTCSGGRIWSPRKNICVCPANRPHWTGRGCISCTGGTRWNAQKRACVRPAPTCTGGRVLKQGKCVCPPSRPVWNGRTCTPRVRPQPQAACPSGWIKVSREKAKALVRQGWQIKQVGSSLCARRRAQPRPQLR